MCWPFRARLATRTARAVARRHPDPRTLGPPFSRGASVGKALSYLSFLLAAAIKFIRMPAPDAVVCLTTPPFVGLLGLALRYLRGTRLVIWEMDVYPDVAADLGALSPHGLACRILTRLGRFLRNRADVIIALGEDMRDRLIAGGVRPEVIRIAENWADGSLLHGSPVPLGPEIRLLYSGNLGLAHDVTTVEAAMAALREDPRFRFAFAGSGPLRAGLETRCRAAALAQRRVPVLLPALRASGEPRRLPHRPRHPEPGHPRLRRSQQDL